MEVLRGRNQNSSAATPRFSSSSPFVSLPWRPQQERDQSKGTLPEAGQTRPWDVSPTKIDFIRQFAFASKHFRSAGRRLSIRSNTGTRGLRHTRSACVFSVHMIRHVVGLLVKWPARSRTTTASPTVGAQVGDEALETASKSDAGYYRPDSSRGSVGVIRLVKSEASVERASEIETWELIGCENRCN